MEIRITTTHMLKVLYVIAWILFIGLCVEAGGFIVNTVIAMWFRPAAAGQFWGQADLSALYAHDRGYFLVETSLMSIAAVMKALLFYLIVKILHDKKLDMSRPFNNEVRRFISNAAYLALGIGLFSAWGARNTDWLAKQGVTMPDIASLGLGGADVWLFMGVTLFVIAQIFKRGIEIQSENELTV